MQEKPKPTRPALFSPEWWTLRRAVMADIAAEQARLQRDLPLDVDKDPKARAALIRRSDAAMTLALYGASSGRDGTRDLEDEYVRVSGPC